MLLLADDAALRHATRSFLTVEGYRVMSAATLADAMKVAWHWRDIGILLVNEPVSDGAMAGRAIVTLRQIIGPGLRALLITGELSADLRALRHDPLVRLATSPIDADALAAQLQALSPESIPTS